MRYSSGMLDLIVDRIMENISFDYASFSEAVLTIGVDDTPEIKLTFDRLSMRVYSHNLPDEDFSYVIKNLRRRYQEECSREDLKARVEYNVLLDFLLLHQEYVEYKIAKETRPDFVLSGDRRIGIEVTEFTTEVDKVLVAIANRNFGQDKTANEIHESARLKHGSKADRYSYAAHQQYPECISMRRQPGELSRLSVLKKHIQKMFNSYFRFASRSAKVIQRLLQVH